MKKNKALYTSDKQNWQTPPEMLDLVRQVGPIVLDPCSASDNPTKAMMWYTEKEDGLAQPWSKNGVNYVNPPYKYADTWVKKCVAEWTRGCEVVALIPARTDTKYYHEWIFQTANAICFLKGRIKFLEPTAEGPKAKDAAPMPNALILWTHDPASIRAFEQAFRAKGKVLVFRGC